MRSGAVRLAGRCFGFTVAGVATAAGAQDVRTGLLVSTGVSAETNPYSEARTDGGSLALTAEVQPLVNWRTNTSSFDIRGLAQFRQFVRRYGLEDNYGADANVVTRASERVTLRAGVGAQYNEGGFGGYGRPSLSPVAGVGIPPGGTLPLDPVTTPVTPDPTTTIPDSSVASQLPLLSDVTLLGWRMRTTSLYGRAGADARLSARSQVGIDVDARALRFARTIASEFNSARLGANYSYKLNELTSVGVIGSVEKIDYLRTRVGDAIIRTGQLSLDRRFSAKWEASAGAGVSVSTIKQVPPFPTVQLTSFSIQGRFCYADQYSRLCVSGSRAPQPSAIGGVRVADALGVSYSRRLSEREGVALSGSYSRTGQSRGALLAQPPVDFYSGSARYDNRLGPRTTFFASGSASKINGYLAPRRANFGVAMGLQFRFGALQ